MNPDVDTLGLPIVKLRLPEYKALTQRANTAESAKADAGEDKKDHRRELPLVVLLFGRATCWSLALACFLAACFLSILHWTDTWNVPAGVIGWFSLGVTIFIVSAHAIRAAIHHRQMLALADEIRAELRAEIRDHAPADAIELARIATMVERVWAAMLKQEEQLISLRSDLMLMKADAERFVDQRSEAEEVDGETVASVTHLPGRNRSALPRKDDHS